MRLLQKVWPWNPKVSWFSRMSICRAGLSIKMDSETQNICVNPFERCQDYKCKGLFADEGEVGKEKPKGAYGKHNIVNRWV